MLKCRPPGNRTPEPVEVEACRPYLERQIALIRPQLIVALGKSAATLLLGTDASIASLRGRVHRFRDVPLVVTYHPAYLLRSLQEKAKAWEDLLFARRTAAASEVRGRYRCGRVVTARPRHAAAPRPSRRAACRVPARARFGAFPTCVARGMAPHLSLPARIALARRITSGGTMFRKFAAILAALAVADAFRLRLQHAADAGRGHQGRVVRGAEPVPAPRRSRAEPRQHGEGLRRAGREGADRGDAGPRQRGRHQGHAGADQRSGSVRQVPSRAERSSGGALSRLLVVAENYPNLKSDALFRDLQSQLEGTENRITVARNRYIKTVQEYNTTVRQFPTNLTAMIFGHKVKPNFAVADEAAVSAPPKVDFTKAPAAPAVPAPAAAAPRRRRRRTGGAGAAAGRPAEEGAH